MNEIVQRFLKQTIDIWIKPEIDKRKNEKRIPNDFELRAAQIIFSLDKGWNKVRLNGEVKAKIKCKKKLQKNKGDLIYENEIEIKNIESIELTEKDPNSAHITLLRVKNEWIIAFDFRYNKKRIKNHIQAAKEFYDSAKDNLSNKRLRPFFENCFACAELAAKSILLQLPDKKLLFDKDHDSRIKKFQNWTNLGNVNKNYYTLLNRLNKLRPSARYLCSTEYQKENPTDIINTLNEMINFAENSLK